MITLYKLAEEQKEGQLNVREVPNNSTPAPKQKEVYLTKFVKKALSFLERKSRNHSLSIGNPVKLIWKRPVSA